MAVLLRRPGSSRPVLITAPAPSHEKEWPSPFRDSFHSEQALKEDAKRQEAKKVAKVAQPAAKKIIILKGSPAKPSNASTSTTRPSPAPTTSRTGTTDADLTNVLNGVDYSASLAEFPNVRVGETVRIANSMFPWVKHYAPGELCKVEAVADYLNLSHEDPVKFRVHTLRVTSPGAHKDNIITLFRHEFAKVADKPAPAPVSSVNIVK